MPLDVAHPGLCSWSVRPRDPEHLADLVVSTGLSKVQLALGPVTADPRVWGKVQAVLSKRGIRIASGMFSTVGEDYSTLQSIRRTGGVVPDDTWPANRRAAQATARIAADLGLRLVSTHAGFLPHDPADPAFEKLAGRIGEIAALFARHGLTLAFETGQETADTLEQFLTSLEQRGHRNLGVNFDPANMILYGMGDPVASLRRLLPRVRQVHIKDAVRAAVPGDWGREMPVGQGEVDWPAFLAALDGAGFAGDLIIEREAGEDRVGDVRLAAAHLAAAGRGR